MEMEGSRAGIISEMIDVFKTSMQANNFFTPTTLALFPVHGGGFKRTPQGSRRFGEEVPSIP
jgi:hypothetical protein